MPQEKWQPGETLCKQGDYGDTLFIITKGKVAVEVNNGESNQKVAELQAGSITGEMSLLDQHARSATLRAEENTTAYVISSPPI